MGKHVHRTGTGSEVLVGFRCFGVFNPQFSEWF